MRILFDGGAIGDISKSTGIGNYSVSLIKNLTFLFPGHEYAIYFLGLKDTFDHKMYRGKINLNQRKIPIPRKLLDFAANQTGRSSIPLDRVLGSPDIVHLLGPITCNPWLNRAKLIITVHDLTFMTNPDTHIPITLSVNKTIQKTLVRADHLVADSEATRADILKLTKVPEDKVSVVYLSYDSQYRLIENENAVDETKAKFGIFGDYIIVIGSLEPRKNMVRIIETFTRLKKMENRPEKLVIVGKKGWLFDPILSAANESKNHEDIIFTDFVPTEELVYLLNGAKVMVYPSLAEGFGIPILEAMACGVPVVTSNISSMPEVGGDAVVYCNPFDVDDIATGILRVLENREYAQSLREKGFKNISNFSWEKTARKTMDVYKRALGN